MTSLGFSSRIGPEKSSPEDIEWKRRESLPKPRTRQRKRDKIASILSYSPKSKKEVIYSNIPIFGHIKKCWRSQTLMTVSWGMIMHQMMSAVMAARTNHKGWTLYPKDKLSWTIQEWHHWNRTHLFCMLWILCVNCEAWIYFWQTIPRNLFGASLCWKSECFHLFFMHSNKFCSSFIAWAWTTDNLFNVEGCN